LGNDPPGGVFFAVDIDFDDHLLLIVRTIAFQEFIWEQVLVGERQVMGISRLLLKLQGLLFRDIGLLLLNKVTEGYVSFIGSVSAITLTGIDVIEGAGFLNIQSGAVACQSFIATPRTSARSPGRPAR
jgi:hypothetical protein